MGEEKKDDKLHHAHGNKGNVAKNDSEGSSCSNKGKDSPAKDKNVKESENVDVKDGGGDEEGRVNIPEFMEDSSDDDDDDKDCEGSSMVTAWPAKGSMTKVDSVVEQKTY
ncbi:hypothetical protein GUJ93_ZPchr0008g11490 [Zizania palustris]|uniref:Uncharacterized protein n=1 Tax=Zizania palustris TaxID=103762 RepID=A0A8J5QYR1_ZIZPA|nr:hypothetical protein GUJ93_ZPchr0008g11490 [Zizania palustris]